MTRKPKENNETMSTTYSPDQLVEGHNIRSERRKFTQDNAAKINESDFNAVSPHLFIFAPLTFCFPKHPREQRHSKKTLLKEENIKKIKIIQKSSR